MIVRVQQVLVDEAEVAPLDEITAESTGDFASLAMSLAEVGGV
jgi:hypothetical protein